MLCKINIFFIANFTSDSHKRKFEATTFKMKYLQNKIPAGSMRGL